MLALLWLCFVVRGIYYASVLPLWEGYDEYSHYAYLEYLIHEHAVPVPGLARNSYEIESSLRAYPLPWTLQDLHPGVISYDRWWKLTVAERERRLSSVAPSHAQDPGGGVVYEAQQPPLYYWALAPVLAVAERRAMTLVQRVILLRCASILLCSLALPFGWAMARRVFGSDAAALGIVAIVVCMPELLINVARVGNESMAVVAGAALTLGCVAVSEGDRTWRAALGTGVALGACLLTKVYFLSALPAVWTVFLLRRNGKGLAATLLAAAASGWWYRFMDQATGDPTGMIQSVALRQVTAAEKIHAALHLNWLRGLDVAMLSHLWFGGWSFLHLRSWIYHGLYVVFLAAAVGVVLAAIRGKWRAFLAPALLEFCLCAGLAYHVVLGQIGYGVPMTSGWYLYCLVFAEIVLVVMGLREVLPAPAKRWVAPGLAAIFALLDAYGLTFIQIPYYTGITAHLENGKLPAWHLSQAAELAQRAGGWWLLYAAATLCAAAMACRLALTPRTETHRLASFQ
jgi:hypothetical protein